MREKNTNRGSWFAPKSALLLPVKTHDDALWKLPQGIPAHSCPQGMQANHRRIFSETTIPCMTITWLCKEIIHIAAGLEVIWCAVPIFRLYMWSWPVAANSYKTYQKRTKNLNIYFARSHKSLKNYLPRSSDGGLRKLSSRSNILFARHFCPGEGYGPRKLTQDSFTL